MKPGAPPLRAAKLLDQLRERCRYLHYSLKTEKAYLYWVRFYVRWGAAQSGPSIAIEVGRGSVYAALGIAGTQEILVIASRFLSSETRDFKACRQGLTPLGVQQARY